MASETDAELILRSLDRPECFEAIFDRHAPSVHRYLRRRIGDGLAEELAAETFARAFNARRRFDAHHASALPWLYGIAVNLIRMHRRSEERRLRAYGLVAEPDLQPSSSAEDEARLDAAALGPALSEALATLPPGQREVLLLHAWAGLSHAEIAEALAVSPGNVRKRLHRARVHVAERIEQCGNEVSSDKLFETRTTR
jgi:RNA polymerase sigma factor (sigma-70 family)